MQYEIMLYVGLRGTILTFIITIVAFFKCNVIENVKDLFGGKIKRDNKSRHEKKKLKKTSIKEAKKSCDLENKEEKLESTNVDLRATSRVSKEDLKDKKILDKDATEILDEEKTELLEDEDATEILDEENTELLEEIDATEILDEDDEETSLLEEIDDGFKDRFINEISILVVNIDVDIEI